MSANKIVTFGLIIVTVLVTVYAGSAVFSRIKTELAGRHAMYEKIDQSVVDVHSVPRKFHEEL